MSITTFFTPKIRKGIIHLTVLILAYKFLLHTSNHFHASRLLELCNNSVSIFFFYIHSLLLLPLLIVKKNLKKYLLLTLVCYVVAAIFESWFQAAHSGLIIINEDGTLVDPLYFFLRKDWVIGSVVYSFPSYAAIGLISFVYYFLVTYKKEQTESFSLKHTELVLNIIIVLTIGVLFFGENSATTIVQNLIGFIALVSMFYINALIMTPIFVKQKNYSLYIILLVISSSFFFIFFVLLDESENLSFLQKFQQLSFSILVFSLLAILICSYLYGYIRIKLKAKEQLFNIKLGAKDSELQLLKSQVNPHFLFNTLNILYATALEEKASKTAESTAKLASLIRYMQEDIDKDFIPLENEIKYLQGYIAIQKLRCAVEPKIETKFENLDGKVISPGLLIPFVENAFKYGIDPSKPSKLYVSVICDESTIYFECVNSFDDDFKTYYKEQGFGIGINNAKQRLELVYPKKHSFEVEKEDNTFSVKISVNVK